MGFNLTSVIEKCNPDPQKAGKILLVINALGMVFAAASNTFAAAVDKNTSAEDKKFLVPAGLVTGVANIGLYYAMTEKVINKLKEATKNTLENLGQEGKIEKNVTKFIELKIKKAKNPEIQNSMKELFYEGGDVAKGLTEQAKQAYKDNSIAAAGVLGAFFGAVVGCAILTPIIRDISAYFVQKHMEKKNPDLKEKPYKPYFEPTRIESVRYGNKRQPMTMKNYMLFTNSGRMKV